MSEYSMGEQLARELYDKVKNGTLPLPDDLPKFNRMLKWYGIKPIEPKQEATK